MVGPLWETADKSTVQLTCLKRGTVQSGSGTWRELWKSVIQDAHVQATDGLHTVHV